MTEFFKKLNERDREKCESARSLATGKYGESSFKTCLLPLMWPRNTYHVLRSSPYDSDKAL